MTVGRVRHFYGAFTPVDSVLRRPLFDATQIGGMMALVVIAFVYWFCAGLWLATHLMDTFISRFGPV
jgi:hypothetical protein